MRVSIIASGMGQSGTLTIEALHRLEVADVIIGAKRVIAEYSTMKAKLVEAIAAKKIAECIEASDAQEIVVAMSGDTGFYSGTKSLLIALQDFTQKGHEVEVLPGVSSVQYMASIIGKPWQNVKLASAHGKNCNIIGIVLSHKESFFLTGGELTVSVILQQLIKAGLENVTVFIGERLSYENERVTCGIAEELVEQNFDVLSVMWIVRDEIFRDVHSTIRDDDFIRAKVPMTKGEVRSAICDFFDVAEDDVIYDIGAGTGSVAIKFALRYPMGKVQAVEINPDAVNLIHQNREKLQAFNMEVFAGEATQIIPELDIPQHVFIGGSKGNLAQIVGQVLVKNPKANILVSAVTMETIVEATNLFKELFGDDMEVIQVSVSRGKPVGSYNMLLAENPIFLIGRRV